MNFQSIKSRVIDGFFATQCAECNVRGVWVCPTCKETVPPLSVRECDRCGVESIAQCECAYLPIELDRMTAAYPLLGWVRSDVHRFKYEGEFSRAVHIARFMADAAPDLSQVDVLVPVAIDKNRLRSRGYNQALLLAQELSRLVAIPVVDPLSRRRDLSHQIYRSQIERRIAVKDAFTCFDADLVQGKRVLIIDDVITTGATVSSCAEGLVQAGALSASAYAFARG